MGGRPAGEGPRREGPMPDRTRRARRAPELAHRMAPSSPSMAPRSRAAGTPEGTPLGGSFHTPFRRPAGILPFGSLISPQLGGRPRGTTTGGRVAAGPA